MNAIKYSLTIFVVSLILFSCVPQRRYLDVKQKKIDCEQANEQYKEQLRKDTITITEMTARIEKMNKEIMSLKKANIKTKKMRLAHFNMEKIQLLKSLMKQKYIGIEALYPEPKVATANKEHCKPSYF